MFHIGSWLRNSFSFYTIKTRNIKKILLKSSDNLVLPESFLIEVSEKYENNSFMNGMKNFLKDITKSVEIKEKVTNDEYDDILANSIVFLDLIDCSAVNTVIECIVRNTPLIINKHPAIEEVLGSSYPGYYSCLDDVERLCSQESIKEIYEYLCKLDKTNFKIETFISNMESIILEHV